MEKNVPASAGDVRDSSSIPGSGRSPGGGHGTPLQYSCLENPMDRGAWWATVHRVTKSQTRLKQLSTHSHIHGYTTRASQVVLVIKNLPTNAGDIRDASSIPGSGRSPGGGHGNPLQYSCPENPMDREACWAIVYRVTKSWTQLK